MRRLWYTVRLSFWFVPLIIVAVSIGLATVLIGLTSPEMNQALARWPHLFGASAEGARAMMSTIASSMMSVVGVTFSVVLVTLALASSQYSSRILGNFLHSRTTQVTLGIFSGVFTYCLVVIRTIRSGSEGTFVPTLAVFVGVVCAVGAVGVLIFFIHHIGSSIQASSIVSSVAAEALVAVDHLFPQRLGDGPGDTERALPDLSSWKWRPIAASASGYIQSVDNDTLLRVARTRRTVVKMEHAIGGFVVEGTALVAVTMEAAPDEQTIALLQSAFEINSYRTVDQDLGFGIRQLVDVALKALSPGVNDVSTAIMCVDYLSVVLARLATRSSPSLYRYEGAELRVVAKGATFEQLLAGAFDQIRNSAEGNVAILLRLLGAFGMLGGVTDVTERRQALREQARWAAELAERTVKAPHDRRRIDARLAEVNEALGSSEMSSRL